MLKQYLKLLFSKPVKKIKKDDFINRLRSTVIGEGMLHDGNIYLMNYAVKNMPIDGIVFEIGVYGGLSTNLVLYLLKKEKKQQKMIGCDAWIYEGSNDFNASIEPYIDGRKDISRLDYMLHIKNSFIKSCKLLHPNNLPYTCHLKSDEFFKSWNNNNNIEFIDVFNRNFKLTNEKISFAYIDGNHSYEQTRKDFENIAKQLLVNGFVLIDDSADSMHFGSAKFAKEVKQNSDFKLIDKNPNYLFQKIK